MNDSSLQQDRPWAGAGELLDMPAETTAAEARLVFLRRLEQIDYTPPDPWLAGLTLLDHRLGGASFAAAAVADAQHTLLRAEIDDFSREFWALAPAERQERWNALHSHCKSEPALIKHLLHLDAGVELDANGGNRLTGKSAELANRIRQMFPLRMLERTARRQEWLQSTAGQPLQWREAARSLLAAAPALAALDPVLMDELERRPNRYAPTPGTRPRQLSSSPPAQQRRSSDTDDSDSSPNLGRVLWLAILVLGGIVRAFSGSHTDRHSERPPSYYNPPSYDYNTPSYSTPKQQPSWDDEIANRRRKFELPPDTQKLIDDIRRNSESGLSPKSQESLRKIIENNPQLFPATSKRLRTERKESETAPEVRIPPQLTIPELLPRLEVTLE